MICWTAGYWTTARAQLFKRDQTGIKGMDEMKSVMRQCNYKTDPLSHQQCLDGYIEDTKTWSPISTTENCIATRGDRECSREILAQPHSVSTLTGCINS